MYKFLATAAVAATMMAAPAAAVSMDGTLAVSILGVSADISPIDVGSTLTVTGFAASGSVSGDFTGLTPQPLTSTSPFLATNGSIFSFTSAFGDFTGTLSNVVATGPASNRVLSAYALGVFTPLGIYSTYDPGAASLTFSFTQNNQHSDDEAGAIQGGFTLSTPPAGVPEPASWGMLIVGFGLSGFAMRRRRATTVAA
jgi:opacity protein-like surface antigen